LPVARGIKTREEEKVKKKILKAGARGNPLKRERFKNSHKNTKRKRGWKR